MIALFSLPRSPQSRVAQPRVSLTISTDCLDCVCQRAKLRGVTYHVLRDLCLVIQLSLDTASDAHLYNSRSKSC
jgi:hypothetical protein